MVGFGSGRREEEAVAGGEGREGVAHVFVLFLNFMNMQMEKVFEMGCFRISYKFG